MTPARCAWRVAALLAGLALAGRASAQSAITITSAPPPAYTFGAVLTFQIQARSAAGLTEARLFYREEGAGRTMAGQAELSGGPLYSAAYSVDLTRHSLTPFVTLEYWWELRAMDGTRLVVEAQRMVYDDNRFDWQERAAGGLRARWYAADAPFGQAALDTLTAAAARVPDIVPGPAPASARLYIYAGESDGAGVLSNSGRAWAGGHTDPALGVIAVVIPPGPEALALMEQVIPHEVAHLAVYQAAGGAFGYSRVPAWLNEGLAVLSEFQQDAGRDDLLRAARRNDHLFGLAELCAPFPAEPARADLAYRQSASVSDYVRQQYGSEKLAALLAAYGDGADCDTGAQRALGLPLAELERRWLAGRLSADWLPPAAWQTLAPWLILAALALLSPILFALLARTRRMV